MTPEEQKIVEDGVMAAVWITCSAHECKWSQKEQERMARALCILSKDHDRLEQQLAARQPPCVEDGDVLLEEALKKIADAADLLGWDIHVHERGNEMCDGIIVGHPKYSEQALDAFDAAESAADLADPS